MKKISCYLLLAACYLFSTCKPDLKIPKPSSGDADFSKFVALGGNFMAGYQDGALYKDGQQYSVPYQIAKFMHLAGGSASFVQPFMPDNSGLGLNPKPWESAFQTSSRLGYQADCKGVSSLFPIKNNFTVAGAGIYLQHQSESFQNISVPFAKISDYNNSSLGISGNGNPFYSRFASAPGISTMLSDAKAQQPTFFALWAGMEDIYDFASNGGYNKTILSPSSFSLSLDSVLQNFGAATKGILANIPDLTSFPFYTTVPWNGLELSQNQADSLNLLFPGFFNFNGGKNGFVIADAHSPLGYRKMTSGEYVLLSVPLDSLKCDGMGAVTAELPNQYVLDSSEVRSVNEFISQYNMIIAAKAQQYNLALVDMNSYFKQVRAGIKWNGIDYNADFVTGGFFSLDGYHPNQQGYALIANEFVKAINSKFHSTIPTVNCFECSGVKFP